MNKKIKLTDILNSYKLELIDLEQAQKKLFDLFGVVKCPKCAKRNVEPKQNNIRNRCRDCQIFF